MLRPLVAGAVLLLAATGCSDAEPTPRDASSSRAAPASSATPSTTTPTPTPTGYDATSRRLTAAERRAMRGVSWHPGCPVPLADLRVVRLAFHDFGGARRTGRLVVHRDAVATVTEVFARLWELGYPVRRMVPVEAYDGDDFASIEADNTSAFNCRRRTGSGSEWSQHAYGRAIDLNPLENPYVYDGGRTSHPRSVRFLDRTRARQGVLLADGPVVAAFEEAGWHWGGRWPEPTDFQHFSAVDERR